MTTAEKPMRNGVDTANRTLESLPHNGRSPFGRSPERATIRLLGGFEVTVDDAVISEGWWRRRSAASLVKILALTPGHRLHREQVMDLLWPDEPPGDAAPKLHKAAHYARKACGRDAVVLRNDIVVLFPTADVIVDVAVFDQLSRRAVADGDPAAARAAIARYSGELLPDDRYEEWAADRRELLRLRHLNLLRIARQWSEVSELEPGDEDAHIELMRHHLAVGDSNTALLQYQRIERGLDRHFGIAPGPALRQLRDHIVSTITSAPSVGTRPAQRPTTDGRPTTEGTQTQAVDALVAELAELTRRQTVLLETLAGVATAPTPMTR